MNIVVTGATGNIGTALVPQLLGAGHSVHAVVRRPARGWPGAEEVRWTALDLAGDDAGRPFRQLCEGADALAVMRCLERDIGGTFNLAADDLLTGTDLAAALRAVPVRDVRPGVRGLVAAAWAAHLHSLDPGWVDMANRAPMVSCARARDALDWRPRHAAYDVLRELIRGMADGCGADTPALRPRSVRDGLRRFAREGTVARRRMT